MSWYRWWKKEDKFIAKRRNGVTLYTKPRNEFIKSFKNNIINRRLQTKRVMTHMKK